MLQGFCSVFQEIGLRIWHNRFSMDHAARADFLIEVAELLGAALTSPALWVTFCACVDDGLVTEGDKKRLRLAAVRVRSTWTELKSIDFGELGRIWAAGTVDTDYTELQRRIAIEFDTRVAGYTAAASDFDDLLKEMAQPPSNAGSETEIDQ